jgi:hypothetical protein
MSSRSQRHKKTWSSLLLFFHDTFINKWICVCIKHNRGSKRVQHRRIGRLIQSRLSYITTEISWEKGGRGAAIPPHTVALLRKWHPWQKKYAKTTLQWSPSSSMYEYLTDLTNWPWLKQNLEWCPFKKLQRLQKAWQVHSFRGHYYDFLHYLLLKYL